MSAKQVFGSNAVGGKSAHPVRDFFRDVAITARFAVANIRWQYKMFNSSVPTGYSDEVALRKDAPQAFKNELAFRLQGCRGEREQYDASAALVRASRISAGLPVDPVTQQVDRN